MSKAQLNKVIPTGAVALIQLLEKHGVTHIFGIPGAKIDSLFIYCTSQFNYKAGNLQAWAKCCIYGCRNGKVGVCIRAFPDAKPKLHLTKPANRITVIQPVQINTQCFIPDKTGRISKLSKPMLNFRRGVQSKFEGFAYCFHATNIAYIFNRSISMNNEIRKGKNVFIICMYIWSLSLNTVVACSLKQCLSSMARMTLCTFAYHLPAQIFSL